MEQPIAITRVAGTDPVVVTVLDPPIQGELEATVVSVFGTRLRLLLSVDIPTSAYLLVKLNHHWLFGEVGYCRTSSGAFDIGLQVEESLCLGVQKSDAQESREASLLEIVGARQVHQLMVESETQARFEPKIAQRDCTASAALAEGS